MKKYLLALSLILFFASTMNGQKINDCETLVRAMYKKYEKKWYPNLTFTQNTTFYQNNEISKEEVWYEALKMPQGLIIKIGAPDAKNGILFKRDTMYVFQEGTMARKMRRQHELLILGFSVYFDRPEKTLNKLEEAGFDLTYFTEDQRYYIIGNPTTKQAWIEKGRFLFVKMESTQNGVTSQILFNKYRKAEKAWIAPEVLFYQNGALTMKEEYTDIRFPKELSSELFDVKGFNEISLKN